MVSGAVAGARELALRLVATVSEEPVACLVGSLVNETLPLPESDATDTGLRSQLYVQAIRSARAAPAPASRAKAAANRDVERFMTVGPFLSVVLTSLDRRRDNLAESFRVVSPLGPDPAALNEPPLPGERRPACPGAPARPARGRSGQGSPGRGQRAI